MATFQIKPRYVLGELASASGLSRSSLLHMLRRNRVRLKPRHPRRGSRISVSHNALVQAFPELLQTVAEAERDRLGPDIDVEDDHR